MRLYRWFESLKVKIKDIAEDTVEGVSHVAEQASHAVHKSVDVASSAMPPMPVMPALPAMPTLNMGEIKSPREWGIPGMSLLPKKSARGASNEDPAKKLEFE